MAAEKALRVGGRIRCTGRETSREHRGPEVRKRTPVERGRCEQIYMGSECCVFKRSLHGHTHLYILFITHLTSHICGHHRLEHLKGPQTLVFPFPLCLWPRSLALREYVFSPTAVPIFSAVSFCVPRPPPRFHAGPRLDRGITYRRACGHALMCTAHHNTNIGLSTLSRMCVRSATSTS